MASAEQTSGISLDAILKVLFVYALIFRFMVPVYDNPMENLFSDPARHWQNGQYLLTPTFIGGIDPKLYQLYIHLVQWISGSKPAVVAVLTGALSVFTGWVWYRACRELFTRRTALALGIVIALCPSLSAIYTLFMNETLLLALMGAGFWLTLRASRKQELGAALLAAAAWVLTCYTRLIALPMAIACLWYLLLLLPRDRWKVAAFAVVFFAAAAIPAGWHSYQKLKVIAPFGLPHMAQFYHYGHLRTVQINSNEGLYIFSSPSFYHPLGDPFFTYEYCRPEGTAIETINTANGIDDWKAAVEDAKSKYDADKYWCDMQDNLAFLFLGNSWPDSGPKADYKWLYYINFQLRWLWPVLMLGLLICAPLVKKSKPEMLVFTCALGLLLMLIFQQSGVMEGRYRKPLEPLLLIFAAMFFNHSRHGERLSLVQFIKEIYVMPVLRNLGWRRGSDAAHV